MKLLSPISQCCGYRLNGDLQLNAANFINFLKTVNVTMEHTTMALGVSRDHGLFEWGGTNLATLFCQTKNLFSLRMWRLLFDIVRFNQFALDILINADGEDQNYSETIGVYLDRHSYSHAFRDDYLIPITASVWSMSPDKCINEFPVLTLIRVL